MARITGLARSVEAEGRALLAALRRGDRSEAEVRNRQLGRRALTGVEEAVAELQGTEETRLAQQTETWRRTSLAGGLVFGLATLMLLVILVADARLVAREMRARERLSAERADMLHVQQQLMAVVGHDLRSPLAAMKGSAELLARAAGLDEAHRQDARRIGSSARRMERLIRDLLDFSRIRAGAGVPVKCAPADLVQVCRQAVADLGRDAQARVTIDSMGDPTGQWDPDRLEQVAANLVSNALKYGPPRRPVRVVVDGRDAGQVSLDVHDEGGGIAEEQRSALFEPFRRGRSGDAEEAGSSGLGLFIVSRLAEAHGGRVELQSTPEAGTTFSVRLPRGRSPTAAPPAAGG